MNKLHHIICVLLILITGVAALVFLVDAKWVMAGAMFVISATILGVDAFLLKCKNCGARPALWLLAVWTLLLSPDFFISDAILLKRCPRCKNEIF